MAISENIPTYRQLDPNGFFCEAGYLILEGEAFEYDGEPNPQMEALNDPALEKLKKYYAKLDAGARAVAQANGRAYSRQSNDLSDMVAEATADARRVQLRSGDGGVPLMGGTNSDITVKKVILDAAPSVYRRKHTSRGKKEELA